MMYLRLHDIMHVSKMVRWCVINFKLIIMIIMYLDNHNYTYHDNLIIITKNNHDISIFTIIAQY